jgi:hypothetical protein
MMCFGQIGFAAAVPGRFADMSACAVSDTVACVCPIRMLAVVAAVWFSPPGVWLIPLAAARWQARHAAADTR